LETLLGRALGAGRGFQKCFGQLARFLNTAAMYWPDIKKALGLPEGHV